MAYYVQIRNGRQTGLLAGPFDTRKEASEMVDPTVKAACQVDPMAWHMEFGTVRASSLYGFGQPYGRLNAALGLPIAPDGNQVITTVEGGYEPVKPCLS